jgi:2,4-dienoyl-CoA reductase-like NADH-dependent reductase (Old Yellow Enzyme family)
VMVTLRLVGDSSKVTLALPKEPPEWGIRSRAVAEQILATSKVAMVSIARPLVRQPALVRDWQRDRNVVASCVSCNRCFVSLGLDQPLRCGHRGPQSAGAAG